MSVGTWFGTCSAPGARIRAVGFSISTVCSLNLVVWCAQWF